MKVFSFMVRHGTQRKRWTAIRGKCQMIWTRSTFWCTEEGLGIQMSFILFLDAKWASDNFDSNENTCRGMPIVMHEDSNWQYYSGYGLKVYIMNIENIAMRLAEGFKTMRRKNRWVYLKCLKNVSCRIEMLILFRMTCICSSCYLCWFPGDYIFIF